MPAFRQITGTTCAEALHNLGNTLAQVVQQRCTNNAAMLHKIWHTAASLGKHCLTSWEAVFLISRRVAVRMTSHAYTAGGASFK